MTYPKDLKYTEEHAWIRVDGDIATIGITDYLQDKLGELVYVVVDVVGETFDKGNEIGTIEAVKTTVEFFTPVSGEVIEFNATLDESKEDNPAMVNESPYDKGWIVKIKMSDPSEVGGCLDSDDYEAFVHL